MVDRENRDNRIVRAEVNFRTAAVDCRHHVLLGKHDALRRTGCAGGEEHDRQPVQIRRGRRGVAGVGLPCLQDLRKRNHLFVDQLIVRGFHRNEEFQGGVRRDRTVELMREGRGIHDALDFRRGEEPLNLGDRQFLIHRDGDTAGGHDSEERRNPLGRSLTDDGDAPPGKPEGGETRRLVAHHRGEFAVGHLRKVLSTVHKVTVNDSISKSCKMLYQIVKTANRFIDPFRLFDAVHNATPF